MWNISVYVTILNAMGLFLSCGSQSRLHHFRASTRTKSSFKIVVTLELNSWYSCSAFTTRLNMSHPDPCHSAARSLPYTYSFEIFLVSKYKIQR